MRLTAITLALTLACTPLVAASEKDIQKNTERLTEASDLFKEIMDTPDRSIPSDLLENANCIVIVPALKKAAFVLGGKYGRGFTLCRNPNGVPGWGHLRRSVWKAAASVSRSASLPPT